MGRRRSLLTSAFLPVDTVGTHFSPSSRIKQAFLGHSARGTGYTHDLLQMDDEWLKKLPAELLLEVSKRLLHDVKE